MIDLLTHYNPLTDLETLIQAIHQQFPEGPSCYDLAPLDQLHIGGIKASCALLSHFATDAEEINLLDIGAGIGGLLRLATHDQKVKGVALDITHRFGAFNQQLNRLSGVQNIHIVTGDAQQLPLADNLFDGVIFQHSLLNVPQRQQALQEALRVLKPTGRLVCHEVIEGKHPEKLQFPVPWATHPHQSHLTSAAQLTHTLSKIGFTAIHHRDWTQEARQWRTRQTQKEAHPQKPIGLNPEWVLGDTFPQMARHIQLALQDDAVHVIAIHAQKPKHSL